MGRGLILVRHAMPQVSGTIPTTLWPLSEAAKEDCVLLAHTLPDDLAPVVYASPQPKARETAAVIALRRGLQVVTDDAFREVDKPEEWFSTDDGYRAAVVDYLTSGGRPGWDDHGAVAARFALGIARALAATGAGDLVIASHGMVLSIYLASRAPIDLVAFWRALTLPDAWRYDLDSGELERLFEGGLGER